MATARRKTSKWARALAIALPAMVGLPATAHADAVLAQSPCLPFELVETTVVSQGCTRLSAHDGRVLWSAYDAATGQHVLMSAYRGGVARVPVAPRNRSFDADLGEDDAGRVVATYSRCAGDPDGPAKGCVARQIAFAPGARERRLLPGVADADPLLPSRWHRRVAIAQRLLRSEPRQARLCSASGRPRCRTLPGGRAGQAPRSAGPIAIDIDARRYAMAWFGDMQGVVRRHAILVARFDAKKATQIVEIGAGYGGNASVHSPALDGRYVYFARGGASCDYGSSPNRAGRYDLARHTLVEVRTPALAGLAVDAGRVSYAACGRPPGAATASVVAITAADPSPFDRAARSRP